MTGKVVLATCLGHLSASLGNWEGKSLEDVTSWTARQDHPRGLEKEEQDWGGNVTGDKVAP